MEEIVKEFIKTFRNETSQKDTEHVIFHGCWDWHSSVHGHWALLESAHLVKDKENLEWVTERLQSKNMEEEFIGFVFGMIKFFPFKFYEKKSSLGIMTIIANSK